MTKKIPIPKKTTGYIYSGTYVSRKMKNGNLGWFMSTFLGSKSYPGTPDYNQIRKYWPGSRHYLCKVTLTVVRDKKGRPLTKIVR